MKTPSRLVSRALCCCFGLSPFSLGFISTGPTSSAAAARPEESSELRRTEGHVDYQLFAGVDLSAEDGGGFRRIADVSGESLFLQEGKELKKVWAQRIKSYRMVPALKLSETLVTLNDLSADPAYSPGRDPQRQWARRQIAIDTVRSDNHDLAQGRVTRALSLTDPTKPAGYGSESQAALRETERVFSHVNGLDNADAYARAASTEQAEEMYDAIQYNFTLSAPQRIERPYVVAIASISVPEKPETQFDSIYARSIDEIDQKPRTFHVMHVGLPLGFKLKSYRLHVFNNVTELATTRSEQRLPLSKKEAELYLVTQYVADHRSETLAARTALASFPSEFSKQIDPEQLKKRFVLTIDPSGEVANVQVADAPAEPVNEYVEQVLKGFRFYPALIKGKPVEGQLRVKFGDFL